MKKKLLSKYNAIMENRKNKDKGFTLVELVVVIVILAILIGVTIGGVYMYVNQSRTNTDINNAASIQSALSVLSADEDVYKAATKGTYTISWVDAVQPIAGNGTSCADVLAQKIAKICTDGLPKSQTKRGFKLTVDITEDKDITVNCVAVCDDDEGGKNAGTNKIQDITAKSGEITLGTGTSTPSNDVNKGNGQQNGGN